MHLQILVLIMKFAFVNGVGTEDVIYPPITVIMSGGPFSIFCGPMSDDYIVLWKFRSVTDYGEEVIFNGSDILPKFNEYVSRKEKGLSVLSKTHCYSFDAGTYKCMIKHSNETVHGMGTVQLIVLDDKPRCQLKVKYVHLTEGDYLRIQCSVKYTGTIVPTIEWLRSDGINSSIDVAIENHATKSHLTSNFTKQMTAADNNVIFRFAISFGKPPSTDNKKSIQNTTYAPTYEYKANVLFAPKSVNITPKKSTYDNGDILYCVADGNPASSYKWTELGSNRVVAIGSSLTVEGASMKGRTFECVASNEVNGKESSVSTVVTIDSITKDHMELNVFRISTIAVGVFFLLLFLIASAVMCKRLIDRACSINLPLQHCDTNVQSETQQTDNHIFPENVLTRTNTILNLDLKYESIENLAVDTTVSTELNRSSSSRFSLTQDSTTLHRCNLTHYAGLGERKLPKIPLYAKLEGCDPTSDEQQPDINDNGSFVIAATENAHYVNVVLHPKRKHLTDIRLD